jgi:hypothetical protein
VVAFSGPSLFSPLPFGGFISFETLYSTLLRF